MYPRGSHNYYDSSSSPQQRHNNNPHDFYEDTSSEIYVDSTYPQNSHHHHHHGGPAGPPPPPPPRVSRIIPPPQDHHHNVSRPITPMYGGNRPHTTTPSEYSSVSKSKNKNKGGVVIETMSAPNPCCPNQKGVCCILLLVNLGLVLVTLGFSIVLQIFEPKFVWILGFLFLIVGFVALIVSLLFCMRICRYSRWASSSRSDSSIHGTQREPSELYWTHHWQKRINLPGTTSRSSSSNINNNNHDDTTVFHTHQNRGLQSSSS